MGVLTNGLPTARFTLRDGYGNEYPEFSADDSQRDEIPKA
jgi:hypothetical protein